VNPNRFLSGPLILAGLLAATVAQAHLASEDMAEAASKFLASLEDTQRARAEFTFTDDERRNWHFVPQDRKGLPAKDMSPAQRELAMAMLRAAMSDHGFSKATNIMSLELILKDLEGAGARFDRNPGLYYFSIFGQPAGKTPWGFRVEGHHLSVNVSVAGDQAVAVTPSFLGSNPAEVRKGPRRGLRVLAEEEDVARDLLNSLDAGQRQIAVVSTNAPADIITGDRRRVTALEPAGIPSPQLSLEQQAQLIKLIATYVRRFRAEVADGDMRKIQQAGLEKVRFAWFGSLVRGGKHYYRVQGPTFLLEYDNTQNDANHIHSVWRDFANDFGDDMLRQHYEQSPHDPASDKR
jgi:hypothetical protein